MQKTQMDLVVRYWDETESHDKSRYFQSAFLGHARATDLLSTFLDLTKDLESTNIAHIGMDGPSVNKLFLSLLKGDRKKELSDLIDIGSCTIHNMHGAFKNGVDATA